MPGVAVMLFGHVEIVREMDSGLPISGANCRSLCRHRPQSRPSQIAHFSDAVVSLESWSPGAEGFG